MLTSVRTRKTRNAILLIQIELCLFLNQHFEHHSNSAESTFKTCFQFSRTFLCL